MQEIIYNIGANFKESVNNIPDMSEQLSTEENLCKITFNLLVHNYYVNDSNSFTQYRRTSLPPNYGQSLFFHLKCKHINIAQPQGCTRPDFS